MTQHITPALTGPDDVHVYAIRPGLRVLVGRIGQTRPGIYVQTEKRGTRLLASFHGEHERQALVLALDALIDNVNNAIDYVQAHPSQFPETPDDATHATGLDGHTPEGHGTHERPRDEQGGGEGGD